MVFSTQGLNVSNGYQLSLAWADQVSNDSLNFTNYQIFKAIAFCEIHRKN